MAATSSGHAAAARSAEAGRAAQGLELRKAGVPYAVIADRLGYDTAEAAREVIGPLLTDAVADDVRERAALERIRLAGMLTGLYPKARSGDTRAVEQSLRIAGRLQLLDESEADDKRDNQDDDQAEVEGEA